MNMFNKVAAAAAAVHLRRPSSNNNNSNHKNHSNNNNNNNHNSSSNNQNVAHSDGSNNNNNNNNNSSSSRRSCSAALSGNQRAANIMTNDTGRAAAAGDANAQTVEGAAAVATSTALAATQCSNEPPLIVEDIVDTAVATTDALAIAIEAEAAAAAAAAQAEAEAEAAAAAAAEAEAEADDDIDVDCDVDSLASMETLSDNVSIWIDGEKHWISGVDANTTCAELISALLSYQQLDAAAEQPPLASSGEQQGRHANANNKLDGLGMAMSMPAYGAVAGGAPGAGGAGGSGGIENNAINQSTTNTKEAELLRASRALASSYVIVKQLHHSHGEEYLDAGSRVFDVLPARDSLARKQCELLLRHTNATTTAAAAAAAAATKIATAGSSINNNNNNSNNNNNNNNKVSSLLSTDKDSGMGSPVGSSRSARFRRRGKHKAAATAAAAMAAAATSTLMAHWWGAQGNGNTMHPKRSQQQQQKEQQLQQQQQQLNDEKKQQQHQQQQQQQPVAVAVPVLLAEQAEVLELAMAMEGQQQGRHNATPNERLMKIILAQDETIHRQLSLLREKERQILKIEEEKHRVRERELGKNYLLETYLNALDEAEHANLNAQAIDARNPPALTTPMPMAASMEKEAKGGTTMTPFRQLEAPPLSGVHIFIDEPHQLTELAGLDSGNGNSNAACPDGIAWHATEATDELQLYWLEKIYAVNKQLQREEELLLRLHAKVRKQQVKRAYQTKSEVLQQIDKLDTQLALQLNDIHGVERKLLTANEQLKAKLGVLECLGREFEAATTQPLAAVEPQQQQQQQQQASALPLQLQTARDLHNLRQLIEKPALAQRVALQLDEAAAQNNDNAAKLEQQLLLDKNSTHAAAQLAKDTKSIKKQMFAAPSAPAGHAGHGGAASPLTLTTAAIVHQSDTGSGVGVAAAKLQQVYAATSTILSLPQATVAAPTAHFAPATLAAQFDITNLGTLV